MKRSTKIGFSFGITSGIITTLGLLIGLNYGTHSQVIVLGGIIVIAVADALSDALGIHISEEAVVRSGRAIWESTIAAFLTKFFFAITFTIPVLLFELSTAVMINIAYGLILLSALSYYISKKMNRNPWKAILEHLVIAVVVIIATYYIGTMIGTLFV